MHYLTGRPVSRILFVIAAVFIGTVVGGCGSRKTTVTGEVKYNDRPLPSGTITFLGQSGHKQVASADIVDGHYSIQNMEPGPVTVTVVTPPPSRGGQPPHGKAIETPNAPAAKAYVPVPTRFASPDQSGITYEVKSGVQNKDFDLPR